MSISTSKPRILHVDDDTYFLDLFSYLCQSRFAHTPCPSPEEALRLLAVERYDAVITDYEMPVMNGIELMKRIKEVRPGLPVIFLTGQGNENVAREAFTSGASDYFVKDLNGIGSVDRLINSVITLIEKKEAEEALRRSEARYHELFSNVNDAIFLINATSHDLRAPLLNVHGFTLILEEAFRQFESVVMQSLPASYDSREQLQELSKRIAHSINTVNLNIDKMSSLVEGLLHLSRAGRGEINPVLLDMNMLVGMAVSSVAFQIQESSALVEIEPLPPCLGDRGMITQVFSNLIDNALKYNYAGRRPCIHISGRVEDSRAIYCVEDNGVGVSPGMQDRIWEMFQRDCHDRQKSGEGLGLVIVRQIVERHNGAAWVQSRQSEGSRFFVALPSPVPPS
jgi:signal transduction histidine kinase